MELNAFSLGGCNRPQQHGNKITKTTECRPAKKATSRSKPISLANDILESAYNARRNWSGKRDLAEESKRQFEKQLEEACTWEDWRHAADKLDILEGNFAYKLDEDSEDCDIHVIRQRLDRLKRANHEGNIPDMLSLIRNALKRDLGGMCNPRLYQHAKFGTKYLIEEYTEVVKYTIEKITKHCDVVDEAETARIVELLRAARQSFGNTALMLSGGGTLGMCHVGVVKALLEQGVLPRVICGSSAGSIVGAVLCTHRRKDIPSKMDDLCKGDLRVFQGPHEIQGIPGMAYNILKGEPAFDIENLCRVMRGLLGNITFQEAFNYTGMILNIHVSSREKHNAPRLLNYLSAPDVVIWSAVASSCSLPWVFQSPGLKAKNPLTNELEIWGHADDKWIDGSIEGDLPTDVLERVFNVNNFIASQVNPHVVRFLPVEGVDPSLYNKLLSASRSNVLYLLDTLMEQGYDPFLIRMAHGVLSQKYDGDITILPYIGWVPEVKILANPTYEFLQRASHEGEKATWPKLARIHNSVAIELALDNGIRSIRSNGLSKCRRTPSSTRSERGLPRWRSTSTGNFGKLTLGQRFNRGRQISHRPSKSMFEGPVIGPVLTIPPPNTDHVLSSSDETRSGASSPTTEYEDYECPVDSDEGEDSSEDDDEELRRRLLAFSSQPASPSISKKSYWEAHSPASPRVPTAEMKRAMSGLHMSSIDSAMFSPVKKP